MNILIVNMFYYPNIVGGTENSIKILSEGLVNKNHNVVVYTLDGNEKKSYLLPENINGVKVYRSYLKSAYNRWKTGKSCLSEIISNRVNFVWNSNTKQEVERIIEENSIQIIHTNNLMSMGYWTVWHMAKRKKIPVIHTLRDYWLLDPTCILGKSNKIISLLHSAFFKMISNHYVNMVTAPSDGTLELFYKRKFFVSCRRARIVNAIEVSEETLLLSLKEKKNRNKKIIQYLYVGTLTENKGIDFLIDAFRELKNDNLQLVICGSGKLEKLVIYACKLDNRILFKGQLNEEELIQIYKEADVLIVPSHWEEPFGRILIEGAQYAIPTIGSNRGGIPEIIKTLSCGQIYDYNNKHCLKKLILKYSNREKIISDAEHLKDTLKEYSQEKQIKTFENIYDSLCSIK